MSICPICKKEAKLKCSACKDISYCGVKCQKNDWTNHKLFCFAKHHKTNCEEAMKTVLDNKPFDSISQYLHHFHIKDEDLSNKLLLCLIMPNYNKNVKIESYSCLLNIISNDEFSTELKESMKTGKRVIFVNYYDSNYKKDDDSKGSIISFDFDYEKRDQLCYESIKYLDLPVPLVVHPDGRCEYLQK